MWILQMKTEGQLIAIGTDAGGRTELVGGLFYPLGHCPNKPLFIADNADFSATYAVSGYTYNEQVAITNGGEKSSITNKDVPGRGAGANVPLLVVANAERLAKPIAQPDFEPLTPEAWVALHPVPVEDIPVPAPAPVDAPKVEANQLLSGLGEHGKVSLASGSAQLVFLMDRREAPFFMREVVATLDQSWKGPKGTGGEIRPQNGNNLLDFSCMGYRDNHSYDCTAPALAYYPNAAQTVKLSGRLSFFCENKNENDAVSWWVFRIRPPLRAQVIASGAQGHDTSLDLSTVPELQAITLEDNDQLVISGFRNRHNHWADVHMADLLITPLKPE
ncbi:MAG: hypothetical protein PF961_18125 [Planctomycetota bacterium]|jgi:hypothetical protein|nr:hypothetical protein [Planctomycetota bacterium]